MSLPKKGKVVASIEARVGSSRLPGKVLKEIMGKPMLELMIERVKRARYLNEIVIATSVNPKDDSIEKLSRRANVQCFRGSEEDVLTRVLGAAKYVQGDHIVELWGDTPLIDPEIIDDTIQYYLKNDFDSIATFLDKTFPWGMSLIIFSTKMLEQISHNTQDPVDRENVSSYIYEHPEIYKVGNLPCPTVLCRPEIRLTVDEIADFELVKIIFENFLSSNPNFSISDILNFLDSHPKLKELNKNVQQKKIR